MKRTNKTLRAILLVAMVLCACMAAVALPSYTCWEPYRPPCNPSSTCGPIYCEHGCTNQQPFDGTTSGGEIKYREQQPTGYRLWDTLPTTTCDWGCGGWCPECNLMTSYVYQYDTLTQYEIHPGASYYNENCTHEIIQ